MKVSELIAILSALPGDKEVLVNHETITLNSPEIFLSKGAVMFVPRETPALTLALKNPKLQHLQKPSQD